MEALTDRQSEVLRLIRELTEVSGYPPTRAEIAEKMGFRSVNAAEQHLRALEKKGAIDISSGASRGIRVRDARSGGKLGRLLDLPVIGRVAAGAPILAEENIQARYQLDPNLFTPRADYLLRVRGMSMRDAGILEGDLVAVHKTPEARSGQIVVASGVSSKPQTERSAGTSIPQRWAAAMVAAAMPSLLAKIAVGTSSSESRCSAASRPER